MSLDYTTAQPGDDVYLGSVVVKLHLWGQISDLDTPAMMSGSMEVFGDDAALVLDALVGPRGPAGQNSPIVKMRWGITDPNDLPKNLLDDVNDRGITYWIGNQCYVWTGTRWAIHAMGTMGPAGPVPRITPTVWLLDPDGVEESSIDVTGTTTHPSWQMRLKVPKGPPGPAAAMLDALDYEKVATGEAPPLEAGKVLTIIPHPNGAPDTWLIGARSFIGRHVRMFTVPEGAFQPYMGFTQGHAILAYQLPPLPYDYVPFVLGHIRAIGLELSTTPLQVGCEVRLGSALGGTLIGRGHGSPLGWTTLSPHFSSPGDQYTATSPSAPVGLVAAGQPADVFVTLRTEGLLGAYIFSTAGAQLTILTIPTELIVT